MKSILIVIKDEFLSKGITLALLDYFQTIHTTKNPYKAIEILKQEEIDIVITNVNFNTIEADKYIQDISKYAKKFKSIILIKDGPFKLNNFNSADYIIIREQSVSINNIIEIIKTKPNH